MAMHPFKHIFPIFTVLVNELMVFLRSLTCTFLNVIVFVNELTTYERPGALFDVVHGTLCNLERPRKRLRDFIPRFKEFELMILLFSSWR